ncbi:enoyl-CoA hydratase, partial [Stenotrophomonas maltophilia]
MSATQPVLIDAVGDGVAIVTLNRPEAMNALSGAMRGALYDAMRQVDADPAIRCVVLTGAGTRA